MECATRTRLGRASDTLSSARSKTKLTARTSSTPGASIHEADHPYRTDRRLANWLNGRFRQAPRAKHRLDRIAIAEWIRLFRIGSPRCRVALSQQTGLSRSSFHSVETEGTQHTRPSRVNRQLPLRAWPNSWRHQVLDTESGRTFLALIESDTPGVGMSHVVMAERSRDGETVERIHDVISVDAVVNPATTTTFHESISIPTQVQPTPPRGADIAEPTLHTDEGSPAESLRFGNESQGQQPEHRTKPVTTSVAESVPQHTCHDRSHNAASPRRPNTQPKLCRVP